MRKVSIFAFVVALLAAGVSHTFPQQTVNCTATVPTQVTVGVEVQFQGTAALSGGGPGTLYDTDTIVGKLYRVNAGTFTQGVPSTEVGYSGEIQFQHTLTKNLAVMETEVTRQMWADLRAAQTLPVDPTCTGWGSGMTNPVQCVRWYEAVLFANQLSVQRGLGPVYFADAGFGTVINFTNYGSDSVYAKWDANGYRLPTEGEWEYFARAGTTGPFSINEPAYSSSTYQSCTAGALAQLESVAWFCANAGSTTHPVGSKAANPWGLKDVHGNVWEWCWDWWGSYPGSSQTDFRGALMGSVLVIRGGGWGDVPWGARSGVRSYSHPGYGGGYSVGFRLLRSVN